MLRESRRGGTLSTATWDEEMAWTADFAEDADGPAIFLIRVIREIRG
jgi:hypothetical protein